MPRAARLRAASAMSRSGRRSPLARSWAKSLSLPLSETQSVRAIGPEAAGREVGRRRARTRRSSTALAALEVVGVDGVVGAVAVFGEPERGAVGPGAGRVVVVAVEFLDVTGDVPLEVDLARGRAGRSAAAATAREDDWRERYFGDGDAHGADDGPVVTGRDLDRLGRVGFVVPGSMYGHGDRTRVRGQRHLVRGQQLPAAVGEREVIRWRGRAAERQRDRLGLGKGDTVGQDGQPDRAAFGHLRSARREHEDGHVVVGHRHRGRVDGACQVDGRIGRAALDEGRHRAGGLDDAVVECEHGEVGRGGAALEANGRRRRTAQS